MRGLKVLVVVMGLVLVAGVVALGFAVEYRIDHPRPAGSAPSVPPPHASTIDLPAGARVVGAEASGDRLVVRIELAGGSEKLIIVNLATGEPVSTVTLRPTTGVP
ncbi:MAG TPA: DUF6476 family protein [Stellaceae bacterium]|jgi:hypothetical protein